MSHLLESTYDVRIPLRKNYARRTGRIVFQAELKQSLSNRQSPKIRAWSSKHKNSTSPGGPKSRPRPTVAWCRKLCQTIRCWVDPGVGLLNRVLEKVEFQKIHQNINFRSYKKAHLQSWKIKTLSATKSWWDPSSILTFLRVWPQMRCSCRASRTSRLNTIKSIQGKFQKNQNHLLKMSKKLTIQ